MLRRCLLVIAASVTADTAQAQGFAPYETTPSRRGSWSVDVAAQMARPIGGLRTNVDAAWGVGAAVRHHFRWFEPLGLRGDVALLNYGSERQRVPVSSTINRVLVDMTTRNNIAVVSIGPELMLQRGPIQPYLYGFAGYSYFYTETAVGSDGDGEAFASSTNFDDGGLATGWGGGVSIPLRLRSVRLAIDAGGRRTSNGTRNYLRRGDIVDQPDGSLQFNPRTTDADFWQFHLGASFSFRKR
jgi:hypothetical protein